MQELVLQCSHDERDGLSNHQPHDYLLNRLFRRRSEKISKLRATGLCVGNPPVTGELRAHRASNEENVSIWWRHHDVYFQRVYLKVARQLRRLESMQRSPVFAGFSETLSGLSSIRAFEQQQRFIENADSRLNNSVASFYVLQCSFR